MGGTYGTHAGDAGGVTASEVARVVTKTAASITVRVFCNVAVAVGTFTLNALAVHD